MRGFCHFQDQSCSGVRAVPQPLCAESTAPSCHSLGTPPLLPFPSFFLFGHCEGLHSLQQLADCPIWSDPLLAFCLLESTPPPFLLQLFLSPVILISVLDELASVFTSPLPLAKVCFLDILCVSPWNTSNIHAKCSDKFYGVTADGFVNKWAKVSSQTKRGSTSLPIHTWNISNLCHVEGQRERGRESAPAHNMTCSPWILLARDNWMSI